MYASRYLAYCACGASTTKKYAREHDGKCKLCATGIATPGAKCPDCGGPISRAYLAKHYHCDACTRESDPVGYANEVSGAYDY